MLLGWHFALAQNDPMDAPEDYVSKWKIARTNDLPDAFTGGWVGYVGYDTVRYVESKKLPFESAPEDDLGLPDIHLGMYQDCIIFDAANKVKSLRICERP